MENNIFKNRIQKIRKELLKQSKGAVLLLSSKPEIINTRDLTFDYKQDTNFYYFTGSHIKNTLVLIKANEDEPLVLSPHQSKEEILWLGANESPKNLAKKIGGKFIECDLKEESVLKYLKEAEIIHFNASLKMDEEVYSLMTKMIKDNEVIVLLNRNPSINYGSILALRIAAIKHDFNDLTMSLHNSILTPLAGDFDGDVLNLYSLKDNETKELYKEIFSPVSLLIDSKNGKFNDELNLERDQILGLNSLLI